MCVCVCVRVHVFTQEKGSARMLQVCTGVFPLLSFHVTSSSPTLPIFLPIFLVSALCALPLLCTPSFRRRLSFFSALSRSLWMRGPWQREAAAEGLWQRETTVTESETDRGRGGREQSGAARDASFLFCNLVSLVVLHFRLSTFIRGRFHVIRRFLSSPRCASLPIPFCTFLFSFVNLLSLPPTSLPPHSVASIAWCAAQLLSVMSWRRLHFVELFGGTSSLFLIHRRLPYLCAM